MLWTLVLLSLLGAAMSSAGSSRARETTALERDARLDAAAGAAVQLTAFHLLDPGNGHWLADGRPHRERLGDLQLVVAAFSEAGKINPNVAQAPLLSALMQVLGTPREAADALATAMIAWRFPSAATTGTLAGRDYRAPGQPFESLDEIGLVPGMTPALLRALIPHLTLYHDGDPVAARADPAVLRAMQAMAGIEGNADETGFAAPPDTQADDAVTVFAWARDAAGHQSGRRAVILLRGAGGGESDAAPFRIVDWAPVYGLLDDSRVSR